MLGDHLGAARDLTVDIVQRLEESMRRLEEKMSDTHGALRSEIDAVKDGRAGSREDRAFDCCVFFSRLHGV